MFSIYAGKQVLQLIQPVSRSVNRYSKTLAITLLKIHCCIHKQANGKTSFDAATQRFRT